MNIFHKRVDNIAGQTLGIHSQFLQKRHSFVKYSYS